MSVVGFSTDERFDDRDAGILIERRSMLFSQPFQPAQGDWIEFACGTVRRISHVWLDDNGRPKSIQSSTGGSWYLGRGYISHSGGLFTGVPASTLAPTDQRRDAPIWFFHHDQHRAHNGVHAKVPVRVWKCSQEAPSV